MGADPPGRFPSRASTRLTILFISFPGDPLHPAPDWALATTNGLVRSCPLCHRDSIVGHGGRSKQAHDEIHDRIGFRRGICQPCGKTFSFLPWFSLPYTHYSLFARSEALRLRFIERRRWEDAAPVVKDPNRAADSSTLRRWFASLDSSPSSSFLHKTLEVLKERLDQGEILLYRGLRLSWRTVAACLQVLWPLRL